MDDRNRIDRIEAMLRAVLLGDEDLFHHPRYERWFEELFRGEGRWRDGPGREYFEELMYRRRRLHDNIRGIEQKLDAFTAEFHRSLLPSSLGVDEGLFPLTRYVSISIYTTDSESEISAELTQALSRFLDDLGFAFADEFPAIRKSWWKRWFAKTRNALSQQEVRDRFAKAERALELAQLQQRQSEVDKNQASGAADLIRALEKSDHAVLQIGSILLLKQTRPNQGSSVISRTLSPLEMIYLERNPDILRKPDEILQTLTTVSNRSFGDGESQNQNA